MTERVDYGDRETGPYSMPQDGLRTEIMSCVVRISEVVRVADAKRGRK